jgi:PEP-CTERM motif
MNIKFCTAVVMGTIAALMTGWSAGADAAPMIVESGWDGTIRDNIQRDGIPDTSFQSSVVVRLANWEERGILEFDLNGVRNAIAGGATFNSARLELTSFGIDQHTDNFLLHVYGYTGNGQFNMSDFSQGSFLLGQTLDSDVIISKFDVSDFVFDFLDGANRYAGFNLRGGNPGFQFGFYQSRGGPVGVAPRLVFDYTPPTQVPEPASLALFGFGLVAFAAARRRKR